MMSFSDILVVLIVGSIVPFVYCVAVPSLDVMEGCAAMMSCHIPAGVAIAVPCEHRTPRNATVTTPVMSLPFLSLK